MKTGDLVKVGPGHFAIVMADDPSPEGLMSVHQGNGEDHEYPVGALEAVPGFPGSANAANFAGIMAGLLPAGGVPGPARAPAPRGGSHQVGAPKGPAHEHRKP